jgi:thiamine kinase-like enzyme
VIVTVSYQPQPDPGAPDSPEAAAAGRLVPVDAVLDRFPELARPRQIEELPGGLTNRNYRVTTNSGRFVARFWSLDTALLAIDRDAEHYNALVAAEGGVGPTVIGYRPEDGVLVISWLDGKTLDAADLSEPAVLDRVAEACRRLHEGARFVNDFNMFAVQRQYLDLVTERGFRIPTDYLDHQPKVNQIALALSSYPAATVPCHNDLLASNLIDDGERVTIIDYEYSGNNDPAFELGNIWSENDLSLDALEQLVTTYHRAANRRAIARARLWGAISQYGWMLWASIQAAVSELDFDFWSWGLAKYERAIAEFNGPDFDHLLGDIYQTAQ